MLSNPTHTVFVVFTILAITLGASNAGATSSPPDPPTGESASAAMPVSISASPKHPSSRRLFQRSHIDFVAKSKRFTPMIEASGAYMGNAELDGESGQFGLSQLKLDALVPLPLDRDTFLLLGLTSGARRYRFDDVTEASEETLYHVGARIGVGRFINERLLIRAYWQPTISSNFEDGLGSDDWKPWFGDLLAVYRSRENLFWKAGLILTDAFDSVVVPCGGMSWRFAPAWQLDILLPRNTEVSFTPSANWLFLGGFELDGLDSGTYNVRTQTATGKTNNQARVQELRAFLGAMYRFDLNLSSFLKAGAALGGHYDWELPGTVDYDGKLQPSPFVQAGVGWYF